jgi:hypothetical protein
MSWLAAERRCVDRFLSALPQLDSNFDAAANARAGAASVDFDALPPGTRAVYGESREGRLQYMQDVAARRTTHTKIKQTLGQAGMRAVPNDGITPAGRNSCLVLSILHFLPVDPAIRLALAAQYRDILFHAPGIDLAQCTDVGRQRCRAQAGRVDQRGPRPEAEDQRRCRV